MVLVYLIFYSTNLISQCSNGTNYYPSTIYEPVDGVWGSASSCNWAGEVIRVNVKNGDSYEISTCDTYGGIIAGYDTQLTLFDESGNFVGFNDDYTGCSSYTSYLSYTATYDGILYIHLNEYNCTTNQTCTEVMIKRTSAPVGSGGAGNNGFYYQVGVDYSSTSSNRVPAFGYYDYSWSAAVYSSDDLGNQPFTVDRLSWEVTNSVNVTMDNQQVWIGYTDEVEFADGTCPEDGNGPWDGWVKVYDGSINWVTGWNEIILSSVFNYDGVRSIIVKVINSDGSWSNSYPVFRYTTKTNTVVYNYSDGTMPSINGFLNAYRPNMRFNFGGIPLPIELISFDASTNENNNVDLKWITASQVNNNYFTIESSIDGYEWKEVLKVDGCGNCNTQIEYKVVDENPYEGVSYYRLTQTDYDGNFEIFDPVSVTVKSNKEIGLHIVPNPAIDFIHLDLVYPDPNVKPYNHDVRIYNTKGEEVYNMYFMGDLKDFVIDINKLNEGYYVVKSKSDNLNGKGKFIKE